MRNAGVTAVVIVCTVTLRHGAALAGESAAATNDNVVKLQVASDDSRHRSPAAVAVDNGRMVVGLVHSRISGSSGHVDVYRLGDGQWVLDQSILPDHRIEGTPFGSGVSMAGDFCAIGVPGGAIGKPGSVILLKDDGKQYLEVARLHPNVDRVVFTFGFQVALTRDYCAVAAPTDRGDGMEDRSGTVFVFKRTDAGWIPDGEIRAPAEFDTSMFGARLAIDGDTLAIAAACVDDIHAFRASPVFVYRRTDNAWVPDAILEQQAMNANVGPIPRPVSIDAGRLAIGGRSEPPGFHIGIYEQHQGAWVGTTAVICERERSVVDATTVLLRGKSLVVGRGLLKGGDLYVYEFDEAASEWRLVRQLSSECDDSRFGLEVASDGNHVVAVESRSEPHLAIVHISAIDVSE